MFILVTILQSHYFTIKVPKIHQHCPDITYIYLFPFPTPILLPTLLSNFSYSRVVGSPKWGLQMVLKRPGIPIWQFSENWAGGTLPGPENMVLLMILLGLTWMTLAVFKDLKGNTQQCFKEHVVLEIEQGSSYARYVISCNMSLVV